MRAIAVAAVAVLCTGAMGGAAACGGDEGAAGDGKPKVSAANESPRAFVERMAKLLETTRSKRDCRELDEIRVRSLVPLPCPPDKAFRKSMARFEVVGVGEYGTGAVVDYTSGQAKRGAAIVLFVAPDRNWGVARFGVVTDPSTGTSDEKGRAGIRKVVDDYLTAVRERDCKTFAAVTVTGSSEAETCQNVFPATRDLAERLKASPSVTPVYQGGNASYGFYALETPRPVPENITISVVESTPESPKPYVILDAAPSPTAEEQRAVANNVRSNDDEPERSPSRKADSP